MIPILFTNYIGLTLQINEDYDFRLSKIVDMNWLSVLLSLLNWKQYVNARKHYCRSIIFHNSFLIWKFESCHHDR